MAAKRIERLRKVILRKASDVILYELHDPRLGFVTLSKVDLTDDLRYATIYYSVIGADADRSKTSHALEAARGYIQKEIARALQTRVTPHIRFKYDESIEDVGGKVKYDLNYIRNFGLWQDLKILLKTVIVVISARGM